MNRQDALATGLPLAINGGGYDADDNRPEHVEDPHGPSIPAAEPAAPTVIPPVDDVPVEMGWTPPSGVLLPPVEDDVDVVLATIERIEQKLRKRLDPRIMQRLAALEQLVS